MCNRSCYDKRKKHHGPVHYAPSRGPPRHSAKPGHHTRQAQRLGRLGRARAGHVQRLPRLRLRLSSTRIWTLSSTLPLQGLACMSPIAYRTQHMSLCAVSYGAYHGHGHCKRSSRQSPTLVLVARASRGSRWSGAQVAGAAMGGAGMMPELSHVPLGPCRGPWRERRHRTLPTASAAFCRRFVRVCNNCTAYMK